VLFTVRFTSSLKQHATSPVLVQQRGCLYIPKVIFGLQYGEELPPFLLVLVGLQLVLLLLVEQVLFEARWDLAGCVLGWVVSKPFFSASPSASAIYRSKIDSSLSTDSEVEMVSM
jgi:hypothetical protein